MDEPMKEKTTLSYVAIVGRPNVGKSTLFNRIIRERKSIIDDQPGVTRDRLYAHARWEETWFGLIDTAGLVMQDEDMFARHLAENAEIAMNEGDVILFMVDGKTGLLPDDYAIADILRKKKKKVIVVKNKSEKKEDFAYFHDLYELGFEHVIPVSAAYGDGFSSLMDLLMEMLPVKAETLQTADDDIIRLAIVGRPNVGKSTMLNSFLGEERSVVSDVAGTTRDSIDAELMRNKRKYLLIDTAGIRRKSRVDEKLESYMIMRALKNIDRAHVILFLVDGHEGFTEQDDKICGYAHERGVGVILAVNKWDAVEKDEKTYLKVESEIRRQAPFLKYASVLFVSGLEKRNLFKLIDMATEIYESAATKISTSDLNKFLREAVTKKAHPMRKRRRVSFKYITQVGQSPLRFLIFTNAPELVHFSYERYLKNELRSRYGFKGSDIKIEFRANDSKR
ncbi:MAG TPA: ribosome biogenesis GTPase Der [Firmicutes bacterium]|nr:ribosome biogenesis GTPase Der [Bacillota bacterium]